MLLSLTTVQGRLRGKEGWFESRCVLSVVEFTGEAKRPQQVSFKEPTPIPEIRMTEATITGPSSEKASPVMVKTQKFQVEVNNFHE